METFFGPWTEIKVLIIAMIVINITIIVAIIINIFMIIVASWSSLYAEVQVLEEIMMGPEAEQVQRFKVRSD